VRLVAVAAIAALIAALLTSVAFSKLGDTATLKPIAQPKAQLPPSWKVNVDVFSGAYNVVRTRSVASRIGALGYAIERVRKAPQQNYPSTIVYYEPGGKALAARLAKQLGTGIAPLPGGKNARRLVVVVGRR